MKKYILVLILCLIVTSFVQADDGLTLAQQIEQLKIENQQLRKKITQLQNQKKQAVAQKQAIYLIKTVDATTHGTTIQSYERSLAVTHGRKQRYWYQIQATSGSLSGSPSPKTRPWEIQLRLRTPMSQGQLRQIKELRLQVDGQIVTLPVIKHTSHRRRSGVGRAKVKLLDETLVLKLTLDQVTQLGHAKKVTGQFTGTRFAWTREDYNLFRALALELAS